MSRIVPAARLRFLEWGAAPQTIADFGSLVNLDDKGNWPTFLSVEALREKNEDLKDPTYIARKAREDQYYVEEGKNAVIVTNQDSEDDDDSDTTRPQRSQAWYLELLESIEEVGNSSNTTGTD